jgi:hypothetical protein
MKLVVNSNMNGKVFNPLPAVRAALRMVYVSSALWRYILGAVVPSLL